MFCPKCKSAYIQGITTCESCKVDLVESLGKQISDDDVHAYFAGKDVELVTSGPMGMMREVQRMLESASIPTRIIPFSVEEEVGNMHQLFKLEITKDDLDRTRKFMGDQWRNTLASEGVDVEKLGDKQAVLDSGTETECPACGTKFLPKSAQTAECPDCGLFLGVTV